MMFIPSPLCPFCQRQGETVFKLKYRQTSEANPAIEDADGAILLCTGQCGIAYSNVSFNPDAFAALYTKSLDDLSYFNESALQKLRRAALPELIQRQWADPISLSLQIPLYSKRPRRVLDVGCGFGEFSKAYHTLGAEIVATEIVQDLVEHNRRAGDRLSVRPTR